MSEELKALLAVNHFETMVAITEYVALDECGCDDAGECYVCDARAVLAAIDSAAKVVPQ